MFIYECVCGCSQMAYLKATISTHSYTDLLYLLFELPGTV